MTVEDLYRTVSHNQDIQLLNKTEHVEWNGEADDIPIRYMYSWIMQIYPANGTLVIIMDYPGHAISHL